MLKASSLVPLGVLALFLGACGAKSRETGGEANSVGGCASLGISSSSACEACEVTECANYASAVNSACASGLTCLCACSSGDVTCEEECAPGLDCQSGAGALAACVSFSCAASCGSDAGAAPEAGGGPAVTVDAGASFAGPSCTAEGSPISFAPSGATAACQKCAASCATVSDVETACSSYDACYCPCASGDTACQQACAPLEEGTCASATMQASTCVDNDCSSLCGTCPVLQWGSYVGDPSPYTIAAGCPRFTYSGFERFSVGSDGAVMVSSDNGTCQVAAASCSTTYTCQAEDSYDEFSWTLTPTGATSASAKFIATVPVNGTTCVYTSTTTYGPD